MTMKRVRTGECHAISMNGDYVCFRKKKYTEPFISLRHSNAAETKPLSRLQSTRMFTRGPVNPSTLPHMRFSCSSHVVEALTSFSPPGATSCCKHVGFSRCRCHNENNHLYHFIFKVKWYGSGETSRFACSCMKGMVSASIEKKLKIVVQRKKEAVAWKQGSSWGTEKQPEASCLFAAFATLLCVCVCVYGTCVNNMCGSPVCTFFPMRVCLCVQTCALISFYWHCCVTCWILMWDDLFLPLSSRCSQRYPTCFKNTPCDELEDQREATDYYLAVVHKGNLSHVFIYISFSLWTEAYEREKKNMVWDCYSHGQWSTQKNILIMEVLTSSSKCKDWSGS